MMVSGLSLTKLYTILSEKMGNDAAEALTTYVEEKISTQMDDKTTHLATKEDLARVETQIVHVKSEIIKWMVGIFITLVVMILGLYATMIFFFMQWAR